MNNENYQLENEQPQINYQPEMNNTVQINSEYEKLSISKSKSSLLILNRVIILLLAITIIPTIVINVSTFIETLNFYANDRLYYRLNDINSELNRVGITFLTPVSDLLRLAAFIMVIVIWAVTLSNNSRIKNYNLFYGMYGYSNISKARHSGVITFMSLLFIWMIAYITLTVQLQSGRATVLEFQRFILIELFAVILLNGLSIVAYLIDNSKLEKELKNN
jgi:hypothetical protein